MAEALESGVVRADVVRRPERSEELAPGRQFADEIRQLAVVGVAAGLGTKDGDDVVRDAIPVRVECGGAIVEEHEPRGVRRLRRAVEVTRIERAAEPVDAEQVEPAVADERGDAGHRVEQELDGRADLLRPPPASTGRRGLRCACEIEEVGSFGVVELKRAGERFQHGLRDAAGLPPFEPCVVVDADPGEQRNLLPAESRHATCAGSVGAQACLLRRDLRAPGSQELTELVPRVHDASLARCRAG